MNNIEKILYLGKKVSKGSRFCGFTYKKENGEVSKRNLIINVKIPAAQVRRNNPIKGKKSWLTGFGCGPNGFLIQRGTDFYLRGYERGGTVPKVFKLEGISDLK